MLAFSPVEAGLRPARQFPRGQGSEQDARATREMPKIPSNSVPVRNDLDLLFSVIYGDF
jgi:hypothetical protein